MEISKAEFTTAIRNVTCKTLEDLTFSMNENLLAANRRLVAEGKRDVDSAAGYETAIRDMQEIITKVIINVNTFMAGTDNG